MSDMVWAINPVNDNFEKLTIRMRNYAADLLTAREIAFSFETKDVSDSLHLSIEQRKNIFLIFKETVYNAMKYSSCSKFNTSIKQTDHTLIVELDDNGKGFNINQSNSYNGNGISNMKHRAKEIGADLFIQSAEGKGTRISFEMPIK
jgi:signal transduction histidine kinase